MKEYRLSLKCAGRWMYAGKLKGEYTTEKFERYFSTLTATTGMRVKDAETGKIVFEKVKEKKV